MAKKKSQAQINRMIKRAQARGETYEPPPQRPETTHDDDNDDDNDAHAPTTLSPADKAKIAAARQLTKELEQIEKNETLKAKERRSAKRKAEAIAAESAGCSSVELMEWYAAHQAQHASSSSLNSKKRKSASKDSTDNDGEEQYISKNPYIAFVGQLSFNTTKEGLLEHIRETLGQEFDISVQSVKIRLLTNEKTGKSRGMAFVEVDNPELLYALLRLHQTHLDGRRINVERSAGGRANSQTKKQKLEQFRKEQDEYISGVVEKILQEFYNDGTIQPDELDDGVKALFHRHSANVVQAALERYVETNGKQKDNPCAYLTCLVGKMASEGIYSKDDDENKKQSSDKRFSDKKRSTNKNAPTKNRPFNRDKSSRESSSVFETEGVNMRAAQDTSARDIAKIFPSFNRGRGRGGKP